MEIERAKKKKKRRECDFEKKKNNNKNDSLFWGDIFCITHLSISERDTQSSLAIYINRVCISFSFYPFDQNALALSSLVLFHSWCNDNFVLVIIQIIIMVSF